MAKITTQRNGWLIPGTDCGMMNSENAIRIKIKDISKFRKKVTSDSNQASFYNVGIDGQFVSNVEIDVQFVYNVEIDGQFVYKYMTKKNMDDDFERIEFAIVNDIDDGRVF